LRQAWYGEHGKKLIVLRYESLTTDPAGVLHGLYGHVGEEDYPHDFEHLEFDEPEFDEQLNLPGFHKVRPRVEWTTRETILPPDLFTHCDQPFW
jgi:sulfotransferase